MKYEVNWYGLDIFGHFGQKIIGQRILGPVVFECRDQFARSKA